MDAVLSNNAVTTAKVIVTIFFALQLGIVNYLSVLQESSADAQQRQTVEKFKTKFDYIIGKAVTETETVR